MDTLSDFPAVGLGQKYEAESGRVFMTGIQALVRLPLLRRKLDREMGLDTACFISGYRGSPLGGYDKQLWAARERLLAANIVFRPAVNEELAATAVWGSQQTALFPGARHDGVFGIWYGKGPGVDRAGDALKHANFFGTAPFGGVLALAGDDHACKSSTLPNQSDFAFIDAEIPLLCPADIEEVLEFGLKAFDLSRFAGLWTGMKAIAGTMDASATVAIDLSRYRTIAPAGIAAPRGGRNGRLHLTPAQQEETHRHFRLPAAIAFVRANGFDRLVMDSPNARLGIAASGNAYLHVREALDELGLDKGRWAERGLRLYKPGLIAPLDPDGARAFASGLETVLVVEERRDVIEHQLRAAAYELPDGRRPRIFGKSDAAGTPLVSDLMELETADIISALLRVLPNEWRNARIEQAALRLDARNREVQPLHIRTAYFCSGCPHNSSTLVPRGSRALAGIGCHYLASYMDRQTDSYTQMGGEGVPWMGQAPFTDETHIFANIGDGTYFHSGSLAIRQAVAAGDNLTFKILYNDAVAMTGGQPVDGKLTVAQVARQVRAEGVSRIAIVSDDPDRHRWDPVMPPGVSFDHRSRLDRVQRELREVPGVSVLIYDQVCATEKRRRRKRGHMPEAERRIFINEAVCEGCGDCSVKSNCLSVEPVETEFGRKRRINQSTCNEDFSCTDGFCPSFVSVYGGRPRAAPHEVAANFPDPLLPALAEEPYNVLLTGIGGLGVISLAAIIGMAAHLQNRQVRVVDQLGMAQKGGGVTSQIRIAAPDAILHSPHIGAGKADLVLAADMVVAHGPGSLRLMSSARSAIAADGDVSPTAEFVADNAMRVDEAAMRARLTANAKSFYDCPAQVIAQTLLGDTIYANMVLFGFAWQKGLVPLECAAIFRAIEVNGASIEANKKAFALGREAALDSARLRENLVPARRLATTLDELIAIRVRDLTAYQDAAYAARYRDLVEKTRQCEQKLAPESEALTRAVARNLHRLMAIKDEYEVARLYTDGAFAARLREQFDGDVRIAFHLAPPLIARRDPDTGHLQKRRFGAWLGPVMKLLAHMKRVRGTRFDLFGRTAERRMERDLLADYEARVGRLLPLLSPENLSLAADYAGVPDLIRGFGHVKMRNVERARLRYAELEAALTTPQPSLRAAE